MKIDYRIVSGIFAALWVTEAVGNFRNIRHAQNVVENNREVALYLGNRLDAAGVPIDDFDQIALNEINAKHKI